MFRDADEYEGMEVPIANMLNQCQSPPEIKRDDDASMDQWEDDNISTSTRRRRRLPEIKKSWFEILLYNTEDK